MNDSIIKDNKGKTSKQLLWGGPGCNWHCSSCSFYYSRVFHWHLHKHRMCYYRLDSEDSFFNKKTAVLATI